MPRLWDQDHQTRPSARSAAEAHRRDSRHAGWVGSIDSTTFHRESPRPTPHAGDPTLSGGRACFFSRILRIGTRDPTLGPLPANAEAQKRSTDGLSGDQLSTESLLIAHLSQQVQRPQRGRFAEGARLTVQNGDQLFDLLGAKGTLDVVRA